MKSKLSKNDQLVPKLANDARITIIGLGGVGSIVARYGAVFLASLKKDATLLLVDGDNFEPKNASRMLFGDFGNKAEVVRKELLSWANDSKLSIVDIQSYATRKSIKFMVGEGDICLLCVDNHATRKLVSDHCSKLKSVCLISGGNDGVGPDSSGSVRRGTYGNVQLYLRRKGKDITAPLGAYHPEIAKPADKRPDQLNCMELLLSTPQVLFANLSVASAMLNTLLLVLSGKEHYGEIAFDIADGWMRPMVKI